jgi:hypothetical protein
MCINLKTSISAFLIGVLSSLALIKSNNKENNSVGKFILFYTFVQLFEALIYYNNITIYSRLLLINIGLHGLVFMIQLNNNTPINKNYIYICAIISIIIIYKSLKSDFKKATTEGGMKWNFYDEDINNIFHIMYILMFGSVYIYSHKLNNINKFTLLVLFTYIISFYNNFYNVCSINNFDSVCSINKPSIWCLSSAIIAPIMLLFNT